MVSLCVITKKTPQGLGGMSEEPMENSLSLEGARLQFEADDVAPERGVIDRVALVLADRALEARVGADLGHHGVHGVNGELLADLSVG